MKKLVLLASLAAFSIIALPSPAAAQSAKKGAAKAAKRADRDAGEGLTFAKINTDTPVDASAGIAALETFSEGDLAAFTKVVNAMCTASTVTCPDADALAAAFHKADTNADGTLSTAEYSPYKAAAKNELDKLMGKE